MTASRLASGSFGSANDSMRMSAAGCSARAMRPESVSSSTPMNRMPSGAAAMKLPVPQPGSCVATLLMWRSVVHPR
jgi:hypothetical protein